VVTTPPLIRQPGNEVKLSDLVALDIEFTNRQATA